MKAEEVLRLTGITREILSLLVKKGVIRGKKRPNGFYEYNADDVYTYTGKSRKMRVIPVKLVLLMMTPSQKVQSATSLRF